MLVYLHGFNSSPASHKAQLMKTFMESRGLGSRYAVPAHKDTPEAAMQAIEQALAGRDPRGVTFIGSSLGGFYATWLAERFNLRAVLVNPAVRPYDLLAGEVGRQTNFHTGEAYNFTLEHVAELRELEVDAIDPQRYLLMVETGDEVLDYRHAVERYRGAQQLVIKGGDHGFSDFADYLDEVMEFCAAPAG